MQGVNVYITVWDEDVNDVTTFVNYDEVDEFDFNLLQAPGSGVQLVNLFGIRQTDKTE